MRRRGHTSCIIEKIIPNSVSVPVAMTTPDPRPYALHSTTNRWIGERSDAPFRTSVPMYAIQVRSASATESPDGLPAVFSYKHISVPFLLASVSPVRLLSSISRSIEKTIRMSAGIRSPVENVTMSPGTSSLASTWMVSSSLVLKVQCHQYILIGYDAP